MDNYRIYIASEKIYHYIWHTFADIIIEESKPALNGTDEILSSKCNGYVGIPVIMNVEEIPHGMWCVSYPHITLVPPSGSNKFNENIELIGQPIEFDMSELIKTQNTYSHSVILSGEEHHVTRIVLDGQKPFIAKKEMTGIRGDKYIHYIGFPVIM